MFRKLITFALCLVMALSCVAQAAQPAPEQKETALFPKVNTYTAFSDTGTHWALSNIKLCYETGLMKGQGGGRFAPDAQITNAEVAAIAARIHAAITGTQLAPQGDPWYQCYVDHLDGAGVTVVAPKANATRQGFFSMLAAVIPDYMLLPINSIKLLPDTNDPAVLKFYNAGILTGTDEFGTFNGDKPLTRGECAAMTARVVDPTLRRYFTPAGQVPAAPFADTTVMATVNGTAVTFDHFSDVMLSLMEETQTLFIQYGLIFDWEENYGNEAWSWNDFFKSATVHSAAAEILAINKAEQLGCTVEDLALTLFGPPSQVEKDAYALEHNIPLLSPDADSSLAELVLEEKLNSELGKWVDAAEVVTTTAYDQLDPREIWEIYN